MSGIRDSLDRSGCALLAQTLSRSAVDQVTGVLRVVGRPGGAIHFRRGSVVAVESPGAPGLEALLLRSGRVPDADWAEILRAGVRRPGAELVARGYLGAAELQVICTMVMRDAVFAISAGCISECVLDAVADTDTDHPVQVSASHGEEPGRLLQEAVRRLNALASLPHAVLPDQDRLVAAPDATEVDARGANRREILHFANGRRTARDIAFVVGRGVYTVTVEVSRMLADGLLERVSAGLEYSAVHVRTGHPVTRRAEPQTARVGAPAAFLTPGPDSGGGDLGSRGFGSRGFEDVDYGGRNHDACDFDGRGFDGRGFDGRDVGDRDFEDRDFEDRDFSLPRRRPGASGITENLAEGSSEASWKGFFRLRNRIRAAENGASDSSTS